MKKVRLNESDLKRIVKTVINEGYWFKPSHQWSDKYKALNRSDISLSDYVDNIINDMYDDEWRDEVLNDDYYSEFESEESIDRYIEDKRNFLLDHLDEALVEFLMNYEY
jgi:hypothetical protein